MNYRIELKPKAEKDLKVLPVADRARVVERLRWLEDDLRGDVKRLSNHLPEYRMRAITGRFLKSPENRSLCIVSFIEGNPTAMSIHPQIIEKDGRKEFVVLPYEEFLQLQAEIEDYEDLKTLREEKAIAHSEPTRPLDAVLKDLGD